jgi:nucleotide-binding universal stress UspA family protein
MLRRILIGLDNTASSVAALRLGVLWARRYGATLVGLAIVDKPGIRAIEPAWSVGGKPGVDPVYYMGYEPRLAAVQDQAREALDQFARQCEQEGVPHAEVKRIGVPHEQFCEEAKTSDLIVIGRGSQFRFIAGDDEANETLKRVLKESPRPVVVMPRTTPKEGPIVIAFDGSLQAAHALTAFEATGLGESHEVHIFSIGPKATETADLTEIAHALLEKRGIDAVPHALVTSEPAAKVILDQTSRLNASLLVMGAYGQPVFREFLLGSVTRKVLEDTLVPLFLTH